MTLHTNFTLTELLSETSLARIHRGFRKSDGLGVIAKVLRDEFPSELQLARLRHEHELIELLDVPGVVRTFGLEKVGNGLALILEDAGNGSLDRLIHSGGLDLRQSLQIAVALAETVAQIHDRGVLHKDLKPHHVFVAPNDRTRITLIDFGIATRLDHERQAPTQVAQLEGSLPYIAPEQTGRMNRVTDRRSDLYSLGVVLFQLFTGRLPFVASDPLELVHCHLAREPELPTALVHDLPSVLSSIVLKLLRKVAEERYQSAIGVAHDLRRCLETLETRGHVEDFTPGEQDATGELHLTQKLYGREREIEQLQRAFERVKQGASEFTLIAGYSGIGKSALVRELHLHLAVSGYFASGKFEYLNRSVPYAAIAHACGELVQADLAQPPAVLKRRRQSICDALGPNARLMTDLVPALEAIIGPQPAVPELDATQSQHRFERVFVNFISAFTRKGQPVVLFMDDLQWADAASLRLLQLALSESSIESLFVLGAYRDNEVDGTHPLSFAREDAVRAGVPLTELRISPLEEPDIIAFVADTLALDHDSVRPLAGVLIEKTRGNPFFLGQFLTTLAQDGALWFDLERRTWAWDLETIRNAVATDNVVDFMLSKLSKLAREPQRLLQLAACIGHEFDSRTLALVSDIPGREMGRHLWSVLGEGLLVPLDGNYRFCQSGDIGQEFTSRYRFLHDRVQQAAYHQMGDNERRQAHLTIGRMLLGGSEGIPETGLFDIADHLNRASELLTDARERRRLAAINVAAGRSARATAASEAAAHYLAAAIDLLGERGWTTDYDVMLAAHRLKAECDFLNGKSEEAFASLDEGEKHSKTQLHRAPLLNTRTALLTNLGRLAEAVRTSIETIRLLGGEVPSPDDIPALEAAVEDEFRAFQEERAGRSVESFADSPEMTDPTHLALMQTFATAIPSTFQSVRELMVVLVLKAARLQLRHGRAPSTPFFHNQYGLVHAIITGDRATGHEFGQLGVSLAERDGNPALTVPALFIFAGFHVHWRQPIQVSLDHLRQALRLSLEVGDAGHTGYAVAFEQSYRFYAGEPLEEIDEVLPSYFEIVNRTNDVINRGFLLALRQAIAALRGKTEASHRLDSQGFSEAEYESASPPPVLAFYGAAKALVRFVAGHYEEALRATEEFHPLPNILYIAEYTLFHALALAQVARAAPPDTRASYIERVQEDATTMAQWAEDCAANHAHRAALARAELAVLEGDVIGAITLYDQAIEAARSNGFIQHQAIANELCGQFLIEQGRTKIARPYLTEAHYAYARWGATTKTKELEATYGELLDVASNVAVSPSVSPHRTTTTIQPSYLGSLDLTTVIRATETIASELVFETVLERLMRSLIENAGAQSGILALHDGDELRLAGVITVSPDEVRVGMSEPIEGNPRLPAGILRYVARTGEPLVSGDASSDPHFKNDPYVATLRPRSVLCVPMVHQGQLRGVFYLENNAVTEGFTPARVRLLQFLAVQAAAAVENARLYGELNDAKEQLQDANDSLESQVAQRTIELKRALSEIWSEMDLARKIQTVLLPENQRVGDYDVAASMIPADSVGGDYYDVISAHDHAWVVLGDVSGHGVTAGLVMMMFQTAIRTLITAGTLGDDLSPANVLSRANAAVRSNLVRVDEGQYMTATALELWGSTVRYSGLHLDILVYRAASGQVERVETHGVWLGILDDITDLLENETLELRPGDIMLLFTDGLTELRTAEGMLGTDAVASRFQGLADEAAEPAAIVKGMLEVLGGKSAEDDVTLMAVRYAPAEEANQLPEVRIG